MEYRGKTLWLNDSKGSNFPFFVSGGQLLALRGAQTPSRGSRSAVRERLAAAFVVLAGLERRGTRRTKHPAERLVAA